MLKVLESEKYVDTSGSTSDGCDITSGLHWVSLATIHGYTDSVDYSQTLDLRYLFSFVFSLQLSTMMHISVITILWTDLFS